MQTFLSYPDLAKSVRCLDPKRLGNQVWRECLSILHGGWPNHPASKMWKGYELALIHYTLQGLYELRWPTHLKRPKPTNKFLTETFPAVHHKLIDLLGEVDNIGNAWVEAQVGPLKAVKLIIHNAQLPPWFGDQRVHSSHRAALLYKNPSWYKQFGWTEEPDQPDILPNGQLRFHYHWPVN